MSDNFKIKAQYCLPKHLISRIVGKLAAAELGWLTHKLIALFIKQYHVDMSEAQLEKPQDYRSFNEFFTRPLKPECRPVSDDDSDLIYPVDGSISQFGKIEDGKLFQAKGHWYSAQELLGGDGALAAEFQDGEFMTIYLSPKDYHRIHMPLDAKLTEMIYVPGELFSVNPLTADNVPGLFARNERVVAIFDSAQGRFAMVLVGATIVASIETVWAGTVTPPPGKQVRRWQYSSQDATDIVLQKGQEMGRFKLGSTIVMLFEKDGVEFRQGIEPGSVTRLGQPCGELLKQRDNDA
ncbi:MAG: archaetidylserine decarboxylase [Aestuariibacter sp.]